MKSFDGYLKLKLGNDYVLLAGGSHKALSDFLMNNSSYWANIKVSNQPSNATEPIFKTVKITKTMENSDYDCIHLDNHGGWSGALGKMAGIRVTDATDTIGRFGIAWNGEGYFVVRNLYYNNTFGKSGDVFKAKTSGTYAPGYHHTNHDNNDSVLLAGGNYKDLSNFIGILNYDSTNKKILYKKVGDTNYTDLITFGSHAFDSTSYASSSHTHPYSDLTGSGTTANQAILSNGTANLWKLATVSLDGHGHTYLTPHRINDLNDLNGWEMFTGLNITGGLGNSWIHGICVLPNDDHAGYRHVIAFYPYATDAELYIKTQSGGTWGNWRKLLTNANSSVSKSGQTLSVKIDGTTLSLENTWRGILDNLTSTSTTDSLSAALGKVLNDKFGSYLKNTTDTFTGRLTLNGNDGLPLFIKGGIGGYLHGIIIKGAGGWSGIVLGDSDLDTSGITSNGYWIGNNGGLFCIAKGSNGNTSTSIYCDGSNWYTNTNLIRHSGSTYVSSNKGYIGGTEISYVNNSGGADHLNFERVSNMHATTGWRFFTLNNRSPSNGPSTNGWAQGVTFLPNNNTGGYRHIITFWGEGNNNELWIKNQWNGTWGSWRKILDSGNSSVSKSGETLTVNIGGTSQSLTNTWRGILNNLTSDSTTDSLSAAQGKALNTKFGSYLKNTTDTLKGTLTINGNGDLPLYIHNGTYGYKHGILIKAASTWSGIILGDSNVSTSSVMNDNSYFIANNEGLFCISKGSNGNSPVSIYCNGSNWYANTKLILHTGNTYVSSNKGYINNTEITYVNNAGNASAADKLNFERVSDIHATTGWRMFTTTNSSPSNGPVSGKWMLGLTVLPNNDTNGYRNILAFVDCGSDNELWIQTQGAGTWGNWRKILDSSNYSSYAVPLTGGKMTGTLIVQTDGTGSYNQGIRVNRNSTSSWCLIMIGTPPNSTGGTGSSQTGWLVGTPASSNSLIFCPNNASESVGLCLKGSGNNDMKWNDNTVYHAGNISNLYWANVSISTQSKENTTPRFLSLSTYKTGTAADYDAMTIHFAGSWSGAHKNYIGGIGVTDGAGIVGRFGVSYDGSTGYFSVRGLYNGGYAATGEVLKVKPGGTYAPNFYITSDRSKKQNISSFSEHIRKFQLKDTEKWHYGVIAQEVEEMFRDGEEGNMTVNYNSVLSFYIGLLENRVKMLEDKLKKYEEIQNI